MNCCGHCITALIKYEPSGMYITYERESVALDRVVVFVHL